MSRLEGFSTWDLSNNTIGVGPLKHPPQDSTETWFATYIDFDTDYNAFTHQVVAVFDQESLTITRSLSVRDYSGDNTMLLEYVRTKRNELLTRCDWTQVGDIQLTVEKRTEWQVYRQQLRDLPNDCAEVTTFEQIIFPQEPD